MSGTGPEEAGVRVLVTRPEGEWRELRPMLGRAVAAVTFASPIEQRPPAEASPCREALARLGAYTWWVFTSPNGVRFFADAAASAGIDPRRFAARRAAIGPATATALDRRGLPAAIVARDSRGEGMAGAVRGKIGTADVVLLVRPERSRPIVADALRATGAAVADVAFYRTVPSPQAAPLAAAIAAGAYHAVVFTSPSCFDALREASGDPRAFDTALRATLRVAIGPTTASHLEEAGIPADAVLEEPTAAAAARTLSVLLGSESL